MIASRADLKHCSHCASSAKGYFVVGLIVLLAAQLPAAEPILTELQVAPAAFTLSSGRARQQLLVTGKISGTDER